jgi:hypothetical protein
MSIKIRKVEDLKATLTCTIQFSPPMIICC